MKNKYFLVLIAIFCGIFYPAGLLFSDSEIIPLGDIEILNIIRKKNQSEYQIFINGMEIQEGEYLYNVEAEEEYTFILYEDGEEADTVSVYLKQGEVEVIELQGNGLDLRFAYFTAFFINNAKIGVGSGYYFSPYLYAGGAFNLTWSGDGDLLADPAKTYLASIDIDTGYNLIGKWGLKGFHPRMTVGLINKFTFPLTYIPANYSRFHWMPGVYVSFEGNMLPLFFRFIEYYDVINGESDFTFSFGTRFGFRREK